MTETNPANQYWGIHDLMIVIRTCHSQCLTCYGPLNSECLTCSEGFYLEGNTCVEKCSFLSLKDKKQCVEVCPPGYFLDGASCGTC